VLRNNSVPEQRSVGKEIRGPYVIIKSLDPSGKSLSAAAASALYRTRQKTSSDRLRDADRIGPAVTILQLAGHFGGGSPCDANSLASSWLETVLEDEVPSGPTANPSGATGVDSTDRE
jgi:hypothetical protein